MESTSWIPSILVSHENRVLKIIDRESVLRNRKNNNLDALQRQHSTYSQMLQLPFDQIQTVITNLLIPHQAEY